MQYQQLTVWVPEGAYKRLERGLRAEGSIGLMKNSPVSECDFHWRNYAPEKPKKVQELSNGKLTVRKDGTRFNVKMPNQGGPMDICSTLAQNFNEAAQFLIEEAKKLKRNVKQKLNPKNKKV